MIIKKKRRIQNLKKSRGRSPERWEDLKAQSLTQKLDINKNY